ncbi:hypothetical protein D3C72_2562360 [compost metagenome]
MMMPGRRMIAPGRCTRRPNRLPAAVISIADMKMPAGNPHACPANFEIAYPATEAAITHG